MFGALADEAPPVWPPSLVSWLGVLREWVRCLVQSMAFTMSIWASIVVPWGFVEFLHAATASM